MYHDTQLVAYQRIDGKLGVDHLLDSALAAKLKEASEAVDYFKKHKSGKGESKGAGKGGKPARQPKGPRIG